jgi:hypothetical protein
MIAGQCFEFWATGQKNYHGEEPTPGKTQKQELTAPFKRALDASDRFKQYVEQMGITILETGTRITRDDLHATIDIRAKIKDVECIIDLKYSGMIGNKWDELGWNLDMNAMTRREEISFTPAQAEYHGLQVYFNQYVTGLPFFFWIFSSGNDQDSRLVEVTLSDETKARFEAEIAEARAYLERELNTSRGFFPRPSFTECNSCPLDCFMRAKAPIVECITI